MGTPSDHWLGDDGDDSPALDTYPRTWEVGSIRTNRAPGSPIIGWRCAVAGHPGTWEALYGGLGGPITLRAAYLAGSVALDQTLPLSDVDGGGVILDGSAVGFTGALSLRVNGAAGGPFVVDRANTYVGIAQATPTAPLEIGAGNGSLTSLLFSQAAHQRIQKTGSTGLSIVVPNTTNTAVNWFDVVMGTTSKIKVEPGTTGGPNGVISFNNNGVWSGTFAHWSTGQTYITGTAFSGSAQALLTVTGGALTNQNSSVEMLDVLFDLSHTVQQIGGVNHAADRAFKILAPTYSATSALVIDDIATFYINGAPSAGTNLTGTRKEALWIGAGNGGGIRTDGFGASGLIKNNNGGLWTLGVAGTDFVAPWSLTNESVVVSGGGALLVEDNAQFYYRTSRHRLHVLGQTVFGSPVAFFGAGGPQAPTIASNADDFDITELTGPYRDTGVYFPSDGMIAFTTNGLASTVLESAGLMTVALQARYLMGGSETGRSDTSPLVIRGGASTTLTGLTFDTSSVFTATSGTQRAVYFNYLGAAGGFAPTSGTAAMNYLDLAYEVNQTGGANGAVTGLNVVATRTAVVGAHHLAAFGTTARSTMRIDDSNTEAWVYVGEQATGFVDAALFLQTNVRQAYLYLENSAGLLTINSTGIQATALSGTGTQFVQANATGVLSRFTGFVPSSTAALTGPAVVWTDGSGLLNVDTARFAYDATNFKVLVPNGTATHPGVTPFGDPNTGSYSYAADVLGFASGGRHTFRVTSDATSRFAYIGEAATGISGYAYLGFETNARAGAIYLDNSVGNALIPNVPLYAQQNGSHGSPQFAFLSGAVGLYYSAAGIIGISGTPRTDSFGASGFLYNNNGAAWTVVAGSGVGPAMGLTGPAVVWTNGSGVLSVDTARFVWDATNHVLGLDAGSVTHPSWTPIGDPNTGEYSYAADVLGVSTGGRHTGRFTSDASSRFFYIGEGATGISGFAYLGFETNARAGAIYLDNAVGNALISTVPFYLPNGSAGGPSLAFTNSTTTGLYRHSAGRAGMAAAGFLAMRWEATATDRDVWLGEASSGVTGLAYLGFETNARTGAIYLDNALGNALVSTVTWLTQNGSAASPSNALLNSPSTGHYRYAADVLGVATTGRHTFRLLSDSTSRFAYLGEGATGISGYAYLGFETNARAGAIYLDNAFGNGLIATVAFYGVNGSYAGPAWSFVNDGAIGMYRDASGVLGLAGNVLVGDGSVASNAIFTVVATGDNDRAGFTTGGGSYSVPDGTTWSQFFVDHGNTNITKASSPTGAQVWGTIFTRPTYVSTGTGTALTAPGSATVHIEGPPILSGSGWSTYAVPTALWVDTGISYFHEELHVGGNLNGAATGLNICAFKAKGNATTPQIAFFNGGFTGKQTVSGSRSSGAALAALLTALANYTLIVDATTA